MAVQILHASCSWVLAFVRMTKKSGIDFRSSPAPAFAGMTGALNPGWSGERPSELQAAAHGEDESALLHGGAVHLDDGLGRGAGKEDLVAGDGDGLEIGVSGGGVEGQALAGAEGGADGVGYAVAVGDPG